jgi:hypothetical protein
VEQQELQRRARTLRDQAWELARDSLDQGEVQLYGVLEELVRQLTGLIAPSSVGENGSSGSKSALVPIHKRYNGVLHRAELDRSRINGRSGHCILLAGQWMTVSGAYQYATKRGGSNQNGWLFWRYLRDDGTEGQIDEFRRARL